MTETPELPFRPAGRGWLALLGGGELTFGETLDADEAWLEHTPPGAIGFVPAASGSVDYGTHLAEYMREAFDRHVETIPVYRVRDARRGKNLERLADCAGLYFGGGPPDQLLDAVLETPFVDGALERLREGATIVAIAGAAQALGVAARSIFAGAAIPGLRWLVDGVFEPNFDPEHDRRLLELMREPGVRWGVGVPAGSALLLGPEGEVEVAGLAYVMRSGEEGYEVLEGP